MIKQKDDTLKVVYELWEGYHRITALRTLKKEDPSFSVGPIHFVAVDQDCNKDLLFDYCVGMSNFLVFKIHIN